MKKRKLPRSLKPTFSQRFDNAMIETRVIDAIAQADGWSLAEYTMAPLWLQQIYNRHAIAACHELQKIQDNENNLRPSEHE